MTQDVVVSVGMIVTIVASLAGVIGAMAGAVTLLYKTIMERMNLIISNCEAEHLRTREQANSLMQQVIALTAKVAFYEGKQAQVTSNPP
jgi:hypothetical protein